MHDRSGEIEGRLSRFLDDRLKPQLLRPIASLDLAVWHVPMEGDGPGEPVPFATAAGATYADCPVHERWGPAWGTSWFRLRGQTPTDAKHPEIVFDLGWSNRRPGMQAEGLVFRPDGSVVKGLNPFNVWIPTVPGERIDYLVEAAANPTIGLAFRPTKEGDRATSTRSPLYAVRQAEVCERDPDLAELAADVDVLDGLRRTLSETDPRRLEILDAFDRMLDVLDPDDVAKHAGEARTLLAPLLARPAHPSSHRISAIGHAHIDSAWLWPVRETVRKVARTAANVTHLLDSADDFVHCMSSAQQWAWLEEHQPALFARVKAHVDTGRFVPVGGMWVESDTNMVGGEAMVRQFLHGKTWMRDHLGVEPEEVWLPDSFGYTAALPQIVKLAGFRWFLTQKISWNTTNRFPHHTFWWEGIDGTRVFTHFPPADTYNGSLSGAELKRASDQFREKGVATRSLIPFGYGDGGGGPTREMLARARRTADLEGSPRVSIEAPRDFFTAAEREYAERAPVWVGELYLEIHRGTYTSQARTKQGNRRSEHLLRQAEEYAATAAVRGVAEYPYDELRAVWDTVLLNQFHDILPGSSISWVHRQAEREYAEVARTLEGVIGNSLAALDARDPAAPQVPPTRASVEADGLVLDNGVLRATVDETGVVRSLSILATGREAVPPAGAINLLQLHRDTPNEWDAWDIDRFYRQVRTDLSGSASLDGDVVVVRHAFGESSAVQRIRLVGDELRIESDVDWHEREKVLKLAVDADVHTDHALYETQFGHVVRPTHENTTWDAAKFEVCAHRWVQVADAGFALAVANDGTYGHDVTRHQREGGGTFSRVRLTMLRAPRFPDPETDQGRHSFEYAVIPGADVLRAVEAGVRLNLRERAAIEPLIQVDGPVIVEAIKLAEDRSGDVIVRLYEPQGARTSARLTTSFDVGRFAEVDLLERELAADALSGIDGRSASLTLRPFQIVTVRAVRD